jgi:predicted porin
MHKSIITACCAFGAGAVCAQSSVTLWGVVDTALAYGSGSVSHRTHLTSSGLNSSQLGFRGIEELGGATRAGFWLEAGLTGDDGQGAGTSSNNQVSGATAAPAGTQGLTFNRRSTVSVGSSWGELRAGRDYGPQYWNRTFYDPFSNLGVGASQSFTSMMALAPAGGRGPAVRVSNSVSYLWGHGFNALGITGGSGLHAQATYFLGENASGAATSSDGRGWGARIGYNAGALTVAAAAGNTEYATGDFRQAILGGSFDFGWARLMAHYADDKFGSTSAKGYLVGGLVTVGPGQVRLSYSHYETDAAGKPESGKVAMGYVHWLSKRTALYGTYATVKNSGGASQALNGSSTAANSSSRGFDLGVRHVF